MSRVRKSVPTEGMSRWWEVGWAYVMPDFDNRDHSIIEWMAVGNPVEPETRIPTLTGGEDERSTSRA